MTTGLLLAALVGVSLGLLGGGGSILSVLVLSMVFDIPPKAAIAPSLLITGVTSAVALLARRGSSPVSTRTAVTFGGAGMLGAFAGGRLASLVPEAILFTAFGTVMLLTGVAMLRREPTRHERPVKPAPRGVCLVVRVVPLAFGIGLVTGMLGAGGGILIVPALVLHARLPMNDALSTSLLVVALQSFAGFLGHMGADAVDWNVVLPFTLLAALGGVGGRRLAEHASQELVRRSFASVVLLAAVIVIGMQLAHLLTFAPRL